jgi:DNA segregation ATPase FtsK/SpoIIIE-like protein
MGEGSRGRVYWLPARDAHVLAAGETGGGKTSFLYALLLHFLCFPARFKVAIFDPKGSAFPPLRGFDNIVGRGIEASECLEILQSFEVEMDRRRALFKRLGDRDDRWIKDIDTFNKTYSKNKLDRWIVIGDEMAEIMASVNTSKTAMKDNAELTARVGVGKISQRLSRLGRAYGVHLVYASQTTPADIFDTTMRGQFGLRSACGRLSTSASEMLFGDSRGSDFEPSRPGHWLADGSAYRGDYQGVFAEESDVERVREFLRKYMDGYDG